jgi:hypothetical protein
MASPIRAAVQMDRAPPTFTNVRQASRTEYPPTDGVDWNEVVAPTSTTNAAADPARAKSSSKTDPDPNKSSSTHAQLQAANSKQAQLRASPDPTRPALIQGHVAEPPRWRRSHSQLESVCPRHSRSGSSHLRRADHVRRPSHVRRPVTFQGQPRPKASHVPRQPRPKASKVDKQVRVEGQSGSTSRPGRRTSQVGKAG